MLVTGGAGYVGSVSVERLIEAGHDVVILDDLSTGHRESAPNVASLEVGSYGDPDEIARLLERARVDAILHCAARSLVAESVREPSRYYRDNVAGGIVLLEAARQAGVGRLVFSSTAAVYGVPDATPIPETAPLRPINPYGETKRTFEGALRFYGQAYGLRSVSLRYFNVAGATERNGELHEPETHLIPNVLRAAETGEPITLFGSDYPTPDGTCIRDYIHVSDLVRAHSDALAYLRRGGASVTLNCGYGRGFSVLEVIETVKRVADVNFSVERAGRRPGDPARIVADCDRIRAILNCQPRFDNLQTIVAHTLAWEEKLLARGVRRSDRLATGPT